MGSGEKWATRREGPWEGRVEEERFGFKTGVMASLESVSGEILPRFG